MRGQGLGVGTVESQSQAIWMFLSLLELIKDITAMRIQKFMRWQFGSSINPAKELAIFGDMLPTESVGNSMLYRRVVNFDNEAAGYASWFLEGSQPIGHVLTYIVPKEKLPPPVLPTSKIYENGGAFFKSC